MTNVLVSNPSFGRGDFHLPYLWGRLREYCDFQDSRDFSNVKWLEPIWSGPGIPERAQELSDCYNFNQVDVLLLSNYIWNWELNLKIAEIGKKINPNLLVVAGGPQTLYKHYQDLKLYYACDYVYGFEGEAVIADLLYNHMNDLPMDNIPGLVNPRNPQVTIQRPPRVNLQKLTSPYIAYGEEYKQFAAKIRATGVPFMSIMWETNRGCPYKCTFCDWGSLTQSKIKTYAQQTVIDELEFICKEIKPDYLFNPDANFGILPQDVEYAKKVVEMKEKYGTPYHGVSICVAKNNPDRVNEVLNIFHEAEMLPYVPISYQHTDQDVLTAIKRDNIDVNKLSLYMHESFNKGVNMQGTVILGNPGDTYDKWYNALCEMSERRFPDVRVHPFLLLPNAPAADPEYMEEWGIKQKSAWLIKNEIGQINPKDTGTWIPIIYETKTYTKEDYIKMHIISNYFLGLEGMNGIRMITLFLRNYYNISYHDLYKTIPKMPMMQEMWKELDQMFRDWIDYGGMKAITYLDTIYSPETYIKVKCVVEIDRYLKEVEEIILQDYPLVNQEVLKDVIEYQRISIFDWRRDKTAYLKYDIPSIMDKLIPLGPLEDPGNLPLEEKNLKLSLDEDDEDPTKPGRHFMGGFEVPNTLEEYLTSTVHRGWTWRLKNNMSYIKVQEI